MRDLLEWVMVEPPGVPPYVPPGEAAGERRRVLTLLGVDWFVTPRARYAPAWMLVVGLLAGFLASDGHVLEWLVTGVAYGVAIGVGVVWHQVGQVVAGQVTGRPLDGVVFTATLPFQLYSPEEEQPSKVHLVRALGGPAANLALGWVMLILYMLGARHGFVGFLALVNMLYALAAMIPLPTLDGGVVLRELRDWRNDPTEWRVPDR
jgi:Zn-dependent protease